MVTVMAEKKMMTVEGLKKLEDELHERKVIIRKEIADKIKEAREQGDLSENAEYDAARDARQCQPHLECTHEVLLRPFPETCRCNHTRHCMGNI